MLWNWIDWGSWGRRGAALVLLAALAGCATSSEDMLTHGSQTMMDIWRQADGGMGGAVPGSGATAGSGIAAGNIANRQLLDARLTLRRPLTDSEAQAAALDAASYARTSHNEIRQQFHRLPNPDIVMYVFPHLAGTEQVPVPGYSTVFPLHSRVQYAMPGERLEAY